MKEPQMIVKTTDELGRLVRATRKSQALTQQRLAAGSGTGVRFISDLENGKPTIELGKVLAVLNALGLKLEVTPRAYVKRLKDAS